jgi:hypothetical protein
VKNGRPRHFDSLPEAERRAIARYLESIGIPDPRMLREDVDGSKAYILRDYVNARYFLALEKTLQAAKRCDTRTVVGPGE